MRNDPLAPPEGYWWSVEPAPVFGPGWVSVRLSRPEERIPFSELVPVKNRGQADRAIRRAKKRLLREYYEDCRLNRLVKSVTDS